MVIQFIIAGVYKTNKDEPPYNIEYEVIIKGEVVAAFDNEKDALHDLKERM